MTLPRRFRAPALALLPLMIGGASVPAAAQGAATPPPGCTGPASSTWLNVVAENLRSGSGQLVITLYPDNSSRFLASRGQLYVGRIDATNNVTRGCIFVPKPGVYVVALYHDENFNTEFDRTGIGLPAEGYGFSNNPSTLAGLPSFRSVRLNVPKTGLTTRIRMKYP